MDIYTYIKAVLSGVLVYLLSMWLLNDIFFKVIPDEIGMQIAEALEELIFIVFWLPFVILGSSFAYKLQGILSSVLSAMIGTIIVIFYMDITIKQFYGYLAMVLLACLVSTIPFLFSKFIYSPLNKSLTRHSAGP